MKIMVGTPCYDGRIDVWYTNSLINTIRQAIERDIEIIPIWVSFDALLQRARNDTIDIAKSMDVDYLFWIDSDIEWTPEDFFKIIDSGKDVIGGTYPKKSDHEEYVVRQLTTRPIVDGLVEVDGLGTGFVALSREAIQHLWDVSTLYIDPKDNRERRMIFDVVIKDGQLHSEDIHMFSKLQDGGFTIYLDPSITCNHSGPKKWKGNFLDWYKRLLQFNSTKPKRQL